MSRCFVYSLIWPFEHLRMWLNNNTVFRQRLHREENEIGAEFFPRFSQYDRRSVCVCVLRVFMGKHSFRIKMSPAQLGWTPLEVQEKLFFSFLSFFFKQKKKKNISLFLIFFLNFFFGVVLEKMDSEVFTPQLEQFLLTPLVAWVRWSIFPPYSYTSNMHVYVWCFPMNVYLRCVVGENSGPAKPKRPKQSFSVHGVSGWFLPQRGHVEDVSLSMLFYLLIYPPFHLVLLGTACQPRVRGCSRPFVTLMVLRPCLNKNPLPLRGD